MPRRPPPSSLRLHKGPVPSRGGAKHTLPSVPRPVVIPSDVSRATSSRPAPHSRQSSVATSLSPSSSASISVYSSPEQELNNPWGRPYRRSTERALESSGLGLPPLPNSSSPSRSRRGSSSNSSLVSTPVSSGSASQSQSSEVFEQQEQPQFRRGPWDHSRAVSLPFDVGSVLALPKPVAISP